MTGDYTFVTAERQNELTRRIQKKLAAAGRKKTDEISTSQPPSPAPVPGLADGDLLISPILQ